MRHLLQFKPEDKITANRAIRNNDSLNSNLGIVQDGFTFCTGSKGAYTLEDFESTIDIVMSGVGILKDDYTIKEWN